MMAGEKKNLGRVSFFQIANTGCQPFFVIHGKAVIKEEGKQIPIFPLQ